MTHSSSDNGVPTVYPYMYIFLYACMTISVEHAYACDRAKGSGRIPWDNRQHDKGKAATYAVQGWEGAVRGTCSRA